MAAKLVPLMIFAAMVIAFEKKYRSNLKRIEELEKKVANLEK